MTDVNIADAMRCLLRYGETPNGPNGTRTDEVTGTTDAKDGQGAWTTVKHGRKIETKSNAHSNCKIWLSND
jgi:hypothetical protein